MLGIRPGIGGTGPDGGMYIAAGHTTGIGVIAMLSITIITIALSVTDANRVKAIMSYTAV